MISTLLQFVLKITTLHASKTLLPLGKYLGLTQTAVANHVGLDRRTANRMITASAPLPIHAAESVLRLLEMHQLARDAFDTVETALAWLRRPHPLLAEKAPFDWAKSAYGSERVKEILIAIKYGGAA